MDKVRKTMGTQYLFRQTIQVTSEFIKIIVCGITYAFTCPAQIIQRVLEYGQWEDWQLIRSYYGLDKIVSICKSLRTLDPKALAYICCISNTSKEEYRCYHESLRNPTIWNTE